MEISVDLHSHSGASGGVGDVSLEVVVATMKRKGIHVFGTGDAFHDGWLGQLEKLTSPAEAGLLSLAGDDSGARFLLQSEIIITAPVASGGRKGVHTVILLPSFAAAREVAKLLDRWEVKRNIGRPFLKCHDASEVSRCLHEIKEVDESIEIIPAHVLTPQGIYGSNNPVDSMAEFFADGEKLIRVVETGLSADPQVLALIPELDNRVLISNSDCHCGALNRVGREYTTLEADDMSYDSIISAMRAGRVVRTAEFTPAEGRYFLTGHRAGKKGHKDGQYCYFSPEHVPEDNICPICGKELTVGVLQRALYLSKVQGAKRNLDTVTPRQEFVHMLPLVEALAAALGVRSPSSKKVLALYEKTLGVVGTETAFWTLTPQAAEEIVGRVADSNVASAIGAICRGEYTFTPLGYDGEYGSMTLGARGEWFGHDVVEGEPSCTDNNGVQRKLL